MMINILIVVVILASIVDAAKLFSKQAIMRPFLEGNALKVISGLQNFNLESVSNVVNAAYTGGASHVDIACDPALVSMVKSKIDIPVCVSSVEPLKFIAAVQAGADMIEIGNFDSFYESGIKFSSEDVLEMTRETRRLLPEITLSVTIPHHLQLDEQVELAQQLQEAGADIIQTEGKYKSNPAGLGVQEMIELAAPTLASAFAISRAVKIPVMCASGLTDVTAPLALSAGARGVGIGSIVNKLKSPQQMHMAVSAVANAINRQAAAAGATRDVSFDNINNAVNSKVFNK